LPDNPKALKRLIIEREKQTQKQLKDLQAEYARTLYELQLKIAKYEEERRLDRARRFGASSEAGDHQYRMFDEAENREMASPWEVEHLINNI
ncbi:MAG: hypothetical protein O7B25_03170, partial [Gammaproteobacteria bacterium]|nr:hypothetical protein [Gammaproteobacteria bacterium]